MNCEVPKYLYRYLGFNSSYDPYENLYNLLVSGKIYYSSILDFNDPFETFLVKLRLTKETKELGIREVFGHSATLTPELESIYTELENKNHSECHRLFAKCGIICLSDCNDEMLMWSHYADKHKGFCLRFRGTPDCFYESPGFGGIVKVIYVNGVEERQIGPETSGLPVWKKLCTKKLEWAYEREYRIIRRPSSPDSDDGIGFGSFNPRLIDGVFLGLNCTDEDRGKVLKVVELASHNIAVFQAQRSISADGVPSIKFV